MPEQMPLKKLVLTALVLCLLLGVSLAIGFGYFLLSPASKEGADQVFSIREGATLKEVSSELQQRGIIRSRELVLLWSRLRGYSRDIKAGEYRLNPGMSPVKIIEILRKGEIVTHAVTIPEGYTMRQIARLLDEKGLVDEEAFISAGKNPVVARRYGLSGPSLEGYLYPDTYYFGLGLSPASIIDTMVRRFFQIIAPFKERMKQTGMSLQQVVTLASIVEKETGNAKERPLIASVFINRLKRGMRLESDPTVIYGLRGFDGNLKKSHLSEQSPYNTYVIKGLPPGPIANPGKDSIRAVLYPAKTEYLYFVSKNDGTHYFSRTLKEHNRAVETYQKRRRHRAQKTS